MIIIINGSINSGKTTVSKLLAKKLLNTAHIEVDKLREFVDFMPLDQKVIEMNLRNTASIAKTFLYHGLNVIISYPLSKSNYNFLIDKLGLANEKILAFTLNPELDTVASKRGSRELSEWEKERIKHHYESGINKPQYGSIVIDNTNQTPEETVAEIMKHISRA